MAEAHFEQWHEVATDNGPDHWNLCFQYGEFVYHEDGSRERGYRFMWRRPETQHLRPARGGARIPDAAMMFGLIQQAMTEGWFIQCEREERPATAAA
jgi:hypothetical protein